MTRLMVFFVVVGIAVVAFVAMIYKYRLKIMDLLNHACERFLQNKTEDANPTDDNAENAFLSLEDREGNQPSDHKMYNTYVL